MALHAHEGPKLDFAGFDYAGLPVDAETQLDISHTEGKIITLKKLGVPYGEGYEKLATADLVAQARKISEGLNKSGFNVGPDKEIIAMIAYLQRLGTDIKADKHVPAAK